MNYEDYIAMEYGYLADGDVVGGQVCPVCGGGRSKERSLRVSRYKGALSAICYRNTCKWRYRSKGYIPYSSDVKPPKELRPFVTVNPRPLNDDEIRELSVKFDIEEGMFAWARWSHVDDFDNGRGPRVVMPILRPDGTVRGNTYRSWAGHLPKAQINKLADECMMCWYKPNKYGKVLVIVEDQPSALRLAGAVVDSVALCGTLLSDDRLAEIKQQGYDTVYLCLDQDATNTAVKYLAQYKSRAGFLKLKPLKVDVKNMSYADFHDMIRDIKK